MKKHMILMLFFLCVALCQGYKIHYPGFPGSNMGLIGSRSSGLAYDYLTTTMDSFHYTCDVYTDLGAAGNHFSVLCKVPDGNATVDMDQCSTVNPFSGSTCIQCTFQSQGDNYGGYYFLNGTLTGSETEPQPNWGDVPNAGFDLSGTSGITFYARGETGGEKVKFFVGGVGWGSKPYPDSFPKVETGIITLTTQWQLYSIDLQGYDLSYVLSGFGWVATAIDNNNQDITFHLDHIQWNKTRLEAFRFLVSYETNPTQEDFDVLMRNVAFSYDNALALLALLARGTEEDLNRSVLLADGFVHAIFHDRYYDGVWMRNAYSGGDLVQFPGWTPNYRQDTARMPGFWNCGNDSWNEDCFQVSIHTGNIGWVIIALLSSSQVLGNNDYLQAARELAEWVEADFKDYRGNGGYTGGYEGWEPNPILLQYKSTEHNLDLYVAFQRLYEITAEEIWLQSAIHAKNFVQAMWDDIEGKFYTGTYDDGITVNQDVIPLDAQTWGILALRDEHDLYGRALEYAETHHRVGNGFDFNTDGDGIWYEGTAQMAAAYQAVGEIDNAAALITAIESAQLPNGAIPAASIDGLTTGIYMSDGSPWLYYQRGHVGAAAWYLFAKLGVNPYWIGSEISNPTITVIFPNGGENWELGTTQNITWEAVNLSDTVKITLWKDGVLVGTIAEDLDASSGSYPWAVGQYVVGTASAGTGYTVKIKEKGTTVTDTSDASFTILASPEITVTAPNGGENWTTGTTQNITWEAVNLSDTVKITLWKDGVLLGTIAEYLDPLTGSYPWTVGQYAGGTAAAGSGYMVKIKEKGTTVSDDSDAPFTISASASINVTAPNGGENWAGGSIQNITWDASGLSANVKIALWKDGVLVGTIANDLPGSPGSYAWIAGQYDGGIATCGTGYAIKIKEIGTTVSDMSDGTFSITGITVTSPNGGENWQIGVTHNITWNSIGLSANVKITLWKDDVLIGTIVNDVPSSPGSYAWIAGQYEGGTASAGTGYTIKIKEIGTAVSDLSDNPFTLTN